MQGRRLRLRAEQGLGDTLQFCRYVPRVAALGAAVELVVPPSLVPLLDGQFAGVAVVEDRRGLPPADLHCPLLSLPLALGAEPDGASSYLTADPARRAIWRERLG